MLNGSTKSQKQNICVAQPFPCTPRHYTKILKSLINTDHNSLQLPFYSNLPCTSYLSLHSGYHLACPQILLIKIFHKSENETIKCPLTDEQ